MRSYSLQKAILKHISIRNISTLHVTSVKYVERDSLPSAKSKLERHVKSPNVHIVKPFKCDHCTVTFNNKGNRDRHVKEFHLNQN